MTDLTPTPNRHHDLMREIAERDFRASTRRALARRGYRLAYATSLPGQPGARAYTLVGADGGSTIRTFLEVLELAGVTR